jgi:aerobic carbon-monoxide dehydrogenase large subunit
MFQSVPAENRRRRTDHGDGSRWLPRQRPQPNSRIWNKISTRPLEFKDGRFTVAGTHKTIPFAQIALAAYVPHNYPIETVEPGLDETAFYDPTNFTYPAGAHIAEVEIDRNTGEVTLLNFTAADDFGRIINPLIVEGQVHGGLVQGIGQALHEDTIYDAESGQLRTGSLMDCCCGEAGTIGAPAAIMNAVVNALAPLGVTDLAMPATPGRVWHAIAEHAQA